MDARQPVRFDEERKLRSEVGRSSMDCYANERTTILGWGSGRVNHENRKRISQGGKRLKSKRAKLVKRQAAKIGKKIPNAKTRKEEGTEGFARSTAVRPWLRREQEKVVVQIKIGPKKVEAERKDGGVPIRGIT